MYIEKRKSGKSIKYYLVHSYRDNKEIKKIRRYLGLNLSPEELERRRKITEKIILEIIKEFNTEIFNFSLSENQIKKLNEYEGKIKIHHLDGFDWKRFYRKFRL